MKNTKNFIIVGATLLFSALSTGAFAQLNLSNLVPNPAYNKSGGSPTAPAGGQPLPDSILLKMEMNNLRQQWDSLYVKGNVDDLTKTYTEIVFVGKPGGSITIKTSEQIKNAFTELFAKGKFVSFSTQQTNAVLQSDGSIWVVGSYVAVRSDGVQLKGSYDRNVVYLGGKYKIFKQIAK